MPRRIPSIVFAAALAASAAAAAPRAAAGTAEAVQDAAQATPATRATGSAEAESAGVSQALRDFLDPDASVRDSARRRLLALDASELPALVAAVAALPPAQAGAPGLPAALYDIVLHIHLRQAKLQLYATQEPVFPPEMQLPGRGRDSGGDTVAFLGFQLGRPPQLGMPETPTIGVPVSTVMPGFVAYEALVEGDVIVGLRSRLGFRRVASFVEFNEDMGRLAPGDPLELHVLRGGRVERLTVRLDRRVETAGSEWVELRAAARRQADAFWDEHLVPLLARKPGATATAR